MNNDIKQQQLSRINLYALISRLTMNEVTEDLLEIIVNDENILSFFPNFEKWGKRKNSSHKDLIETDLNVDFTNLFLLHLIPYESFYRREDQQMETGGENPVQVLYNEFDFRVELDEARVMAGDHIGVELEFMFKLCEAEMKAIEDGNYEVAADIASIEHDFLEQHLVEWAPMYLLNVKSESSSPFYFDLADLAVEFILSDFQYLSEFKNSGYNYQA